MVSRIRVILGLELVAYYFVAPYIILLGLDEKRGLLDATVPMDLRMWAYALLLGIYPFLLSIVSPYKGRQLDRKRSKISVLRKVHLANFTCYLLLGVAAWLQSYWLAIFALAVPGVVGCASPIGKSLIAQATKPEERVQEFGKLSMIKGAVKLCIPLAGAFIFKFLFGEVSYAPLFLVSAALSLSCFFWSFSFPDICNVSDEASPGCSTNKRPTLQLFMSLMRTNYALLLAFVLLVTGYSVFVKFTPFVLFETIGDNPAIVNYFASLVGLAYTLNQFVVVRFADTIRKSIALLFMVLCSSLILFSTIGPSSVWFLGFFIILFCFSVLNTCIEARLSLQGIASNQGAVQGVLYSVENWGYMIAPLLGSFIAGLSALYPLYFVCILAVCAALFFALSRVVQHETRYS